MRNGQLWKLFTNPLMANIGDIKYTITNNNNYNCYCYCNKGSYTNTTHWNFSSYNNNNPCFDQWAGIVCTCHHYNHAHYYSNYYTYSYYNTNPKLFSQCNVQKIVLINYNLIGTLTSRIGTFKNLTILHIYKNNLFGTLPTELGSLTTIIKLGLAKNRFTGIIPSSLGNLNKLQHLYLSFNSLTGTIPSSLGNLNKLQYLYLYSNSLTGTIPSSIGNLNQLQSLYLYSNSLTGTIPSSLGNLKNLQYLDFHFNSLKGTIPSSLGYLNELYYFILYSNSLTGTIPSTFGNLNKLQLLYLFSNSLIGTIPSSLGTLSQLQYLMLFSNYLTGIIPLSLGNLKKLQGLYLDSSSLTGTIPSSLGALNQLEDLILYSNFLTGTIPWTLGNLNKLQYLELSSNSLSGTILSSLGNLNQFQYLELSSNSLTGTIPSSLGNLYQLKVLFLDSNYLTGIIPSSLGNFNQLQSLDLNFNSLTGTIPSSLGNLNQLYYLYLNSNSLTGTIPSSLGNLNQLQYLYLYSNSLTGTIPSSFGNLKSLFFLLFYSNKLQGDLINIFNSTLQISITTIQINNNQLTGSLPEEIFKLPNLNTFDAVSNCFSGDIPYSTICKSKSITNLILDGLHTATCCRQYIFPGSSLLSSAYSLDNDVFNKIDYCLFKMSSLSTLHLSGNGFTGTLPNNISNSLVDLSLSHNLLTGTIPSSFQSKQWNNLDLSYNRITGTLSSDSYHQTSYNYSLNLQQNRLSGGIPPSLIKLTTINVLSGNIFSCDLTKSNIPQYDPNISNYSCASNIFDISYYIWLGIIFSLLCSILSLLIFGVRWINDKNNKTELFNMIIKLYNFHLNLSLPLAEDNNRSIVVRRVYFMMKTLFYLAVYIITVLLTIYTVNGSFFGIYSYQYAWIVSMAFQSGTVAFGLTFTALCVLVWLLLLLIKTKYFQNVNQNNTPLSFNHEVINTNGKLSSEVKSHLNFNENSVVSNIISSLKWTITPLINIIVVGGVNILYVFLFLTVSSYVIVILQILLAMFKSFWNGFGYRYLNRLINRHYNVDSKSFNHSSLQLFVRLSNNIMIPCVVVALINKDCFYNLIIPPPIVSSQFNYQYCALVNGINNACVQYQNQNQITTFNPPYVYSYQCSSQFITFYSVAFVFLCIIDGFLVPLGQIIIIKLYSYRTTTNKKWIEILKNMMPRILKLDRIDNNIKMERDKFHPYFDSLQLYLNNFTYLGLIMTFGAVFPPLAVSFFVTVVIMNYSFLFKVERFVNYAKEKNKFDYIEVINEECEGCLNNKLVMRAVWMIITISCLFYSLFLFDTLGDAVGVNGAYWVLIVMPLFPLITYIGYKVVIVICRNSNSENIEIDNNSNKKDNEVQLIIISNPIIPSEINNQTDNI